LRTYPRWLGIAILLVIATVFALNHVAARVAFDHGTSVVTGVVFRSGGTALALLAMLFILRTPIRLPAPTTRRALVIGALIALQSYCLYAAVARLPVALALLTFSKEKGSVSNGTYLTLLLCISGSDPCKTLNKNKTSSKYPLVEGLAAAFGCQNFTRQCC
jgi:hypothetical protein